MDTHVMGSNGQGEEKRQQDKRSDHRHTLALDTEIHFNELSLNGMFRCRTSNIGLQGAFIPAKNLPITTNTEIDLVFHARTRPVPKHYRLSAKLVRLEDKGAAMVFCSSSKEQLRDFRRFLFKAKVAARK
jgi:hypothetical protein